MPKLIKIQNPKFIDDIEKIIDLRFMYIQQYIFCRLQLWKSWFNRYNI